ncbi:DUF1877 domain-containing protein [Embleya sp. NBC_00896]|uniref:DUF1877 domain-containing protein n=1 Tax=Embleya sp. NBC_00896 TaxID=2975961 RepID=UPI00386FF8C1|nr:DUF1877 domain-containing protein [Embleya sp. NBC_00896]
MAVTQQLARVSAEYLAACRQSAEESPDGDHHWDPPSEDWLDLDWAPSMLERACELTRLDAVRLEALKRATDGDSDIDLGFLNADPHAIAFFSNSTATALCPDAVVQVSALLEEIDMHAILRSVLNSGTESELGYGFIGDPTEYLLGHFGALRDFYTQAARRGLLVVLWWD